MLPIDSFLTRRGFFADPFASTNSELEERLSDYFVPPPYFESVFGIPNSPKSNVVFAPRGSGKTAQRRMIEARASADSTFLCLTYDNFELVAGAGSSLGAHLTELCRLLVLAILTLLEDEPYDAFFLTDHEKEVIKLATERYLGTLTAGEYEQAVGAVKTLGDKAGDFWRKYGGPVAVGLALLLKKVGLDGVQIPTELAAQSTDSAAGPAYFFNQLVTIAKELGYESVYFLVDKVDETSVTTNNAEAAARLIRDLILSLPTIETPGVAFKFFFWDQMSPRLREDGLRSDRLEVVSLNWTVRELSEMLSRRLRSYSNGAVENFDDLVDDSADIDVSLLLAHLSNGSPRDLIRMARAIVSEHTRLARAADRISLATVYRGVQLFSNESTAEKYPTYASDFGRVSQPSFTITRLASDVFKVSSTAVTNKVQAWIRAGAVTQIGVVPMGRRPHNLYAFSDLRIVLASSPAGEIELGLDNDEWECPQCKTMVISGEASFDCPNCGARLSIELSRSLLQVCRDESTANRG